MPLVPKNRGFMSPQAIEQAVALEKIEINRKFAGASLIVTDSNGTILSFAGTRELSRAGAHVQRSVAAHSEQGK